MPQCAPISVVVCAGRGSLAVCAYEVVRAGGRYCLVRFSRGFAAGRVAWIACARAATSGSAKWLRRGRRDAYPLEGPSCSPVCRGGFRAASTARLVIEHESSGWEPACRTSRRPGEKVAEQDPPDVPFVAAVDEGWDDFDTRSFEDGQFGGGGGMDGVLPTSAQEKANLVERAPSGRDVGDDLLDLGRCESGPAVLVRAHDPVVAELANTLVVVVCAGVEKDHSPVISTAVAVGPQ
jgi:hypothetical protein